mgnify:CR=1 FL=1
MKNKILVIEDDRAISELLCMNLEAAGYETVAAYDGEEAQRLLLWQEDADLAVVDHAAGKRRVCTDGGF